MNAARFITLLLVCAATSGLQADIQFSVAPSRKSPWIKTIGGGYRAQGQPPDPADVALKISVEGNERLAAIVHHIEIDPEALPKGVEWTESQGGQSGPDGEIYHYFHVTRERLFRLRRQDFRNLPDWLKLPKLILQRGTPTPNQTMRRTAACPYV